jgi:DNA-binding transcriptional LysR family regulator
MECGWFAYASEGYLAAHGRPGAPADLQRHRLVLYAEPMHNVAPLRWMESYRGATQQLSRVDNLEIACPTIAADGGIAVLPCFIAEAVPQLRRVFAHAVGVNSGWIVYHETVRDAARIHAVVEALVEFFERNEAMFSGAAAVRR